MFSDYERATQCKSGLAKKLDFSWQCERSKEGFDYFYSSVGDLGEVIIPFSLEIKSTVYKITEPAALKSTRFTVQTQIHTHHVPKLSSLCLTQAGDSKTEQWTWAQYLEECKGAVAAPNKLFQEVCVNKTWRLWPPQRLLHTLTAHQLALLIPHLHRLPHQCSTDKKPVWDVN